MSEQDASVLLEQHLITRYQGEHALFFPRASTGLYVLFQAIREVRGPGEVIIPAMCCETVAMSAMYAGLTPRIGDVDPDTLCLCPSWTKRHVGERTRAIVVVGLFGQPVEADSFLSLPGRESIVLIDDLAQSIGGRIAGEEIGARFDVTLLSFADDKIIAGGGGALILRNQIKREDLDRHVRLLPPAARRAILLEKALSLRNLCHSLYALAWRDASADVHQVFVDALPHYRDLLIRGGSLAKPESIRTQFAEMEHIRERRFAKHRAYVSEIRNTLVTPVALPEGANCWRCSFLCRSPEATKPLSHVLRAEGIHASNHYFSLGRLLYGEALDHADDASSRIINLWVDDATDERVLARTVGIINAFK